jgi:DNA polymerase I-like protein with 3'-5' exonuclease and polymerase domains
MKFAVLDFETYYSADYTLKKQTTEGYVRDPRFKMHCVAVRVMDKLPGPGENPAHNTDVMDDATFRQVAHLAKDYAVVCHKASFDGLILSHHYGVRPAFYFDTLSMARLVFPHDKNHSLEALAKKFNLPSKIVPYNEFRGHRALSPDLYQRLAAGAAHDVELTYIIFRKLLPLIPRSELRVIDMTIRMFTEPALHFDYQGGLDYQQALATSKQNLLSSLGVSKGELQSSEKFAEILRSLGVEPPTKKSEKTGKDIYAFAKTDDAMKELCDDEDDRVSALCNARLGQKSTLNETRAERLLRMCERGNLTVPLRYYGAGASGRFSGEDKINFQNFPRSGEIRRLLMSPPGFVLLVGDLSQIECRMLNWLAGEHWVLDAFAQGRDIYSELATAFYRRLITKSPDTAKERGMGKQVELSCLGPKTKVLTKSGYKSITKITKNDWLWDGVQWVRHAGLLERGKKRVINLGGLFVTPDHLLLCGNSWQEAAACQKEERIFRQVLERGSANLPSQGTNWGVAAALFQSWLSVLAGRPSMRLTCGRLKRDARRAVISALKNNPVAGLKNSMDTLILCLTRLTGRGCLAGLRNALPAAADQRISGFLDMEAGEYTFAKLGKIIEKNFCDISLVCRAGISRSLNSIESITKKVMSPTTFVSLLMQKIIEIKGQLISNKPLLMTYDIALAGPRNRYTVATNAGPIIVHNCGFGSGGPKIALTARRGTYGPPVYITNEEGTAWRDHYRRTHPNVVKLWSMGAQAMVTLFNGQQGQLGPFDIRDHKMIGPGGVWLDYSNLVYKGSDKRGRPDFAVARRQGESRIYGSKFIQNLIEFLSRLVLTDAMLDMQKSYKALMCTHDEGVFLVPEPQAEEAKVHLQKLLTTPPAWCQGIPLEAEVGYDVRYTK